MEPGAYIFAFIIGIISAFFLIRGVKGLIKRKMLVNNPLAKVTPTSPADVVFGILQEKVNQDYPVPEGFINRGKLIEITGKGAVIRALVNILLGLIALFIKLILLKPRWFDSTMSQIFRIIDTF